MPYIVTPSLAAGTLQYSWLDPLGVLRNLSDDANVNVMVGERGLGLPPVDLVDEKGPFFSGTVLRHASIGARVIELPIHITASSGALLETLMDEMYSWFATADEARRTPGYLRVSRQDETERQIACYYSGGFEGALGQDEAGVYWQDVVLQLYAPNPWATDVNDTEYSYDQDDVGDSLIVLNSGQLDAYPVWTINGPASAITITNHTTGKLFALTANSGLTLTSTSVLTIDTRPTTLRTAPSVRDAAGINYFDRLTATSKLWHLLRGTNTIEVEASGVTADTQFALAFLPRYRGLLR